MVQAVRMTCLYTNSLGRLCGRALVVDDPPRCEFHALLSQIDECRNLEEFYELIGALAE